MIRRLRRWWLGRNDSGEICHNAECLRELRLRDLWESREHFRNTSEMTWGGGSYLVGYWCADHAPDDAVRWQP